MICQYEVEEVWFPLSETILEWDEDFHELMLGDKLRMAAYKKAIESVVQPEMIVLDLGTGTGILGLWALEAGAKYLYAIDVNSKILTLAIQRFNQGGFYGRYEVFNAISYEVNLPQRVDLIISEILGNLADNEDFVPILTDARQRFLKKSGRMLPSSVYTQLVPVSSVKAHQQVKSKNIKRLNTKYNLERLLQRLAVESPFNLYYDVILSQQSYLSKPQIAQEFQMDGNDQQVYNVILTFNVEVDGIFTGFKGSFVATLADSVVLDISGSDIAAHTTSDCWKHCYLPIENPVEVKPGDQIQLLYTRFYPTHRNSPFRQCYKWSGNIMRGSSIISYFEQSMESREIFQSLTTDN
ncbi:50S ribosomal protein L11 methyltransferase [Fischerella sp. JS2]|uniref:50S ribosomal protein L11 methyltransferase n=1 Tax=Fischerella sp. JS2 TaxID=2597771 RepID=UPI0028E827A9|nr:50S ribosomal protein L11 methyltransferase [Fischerella sp. JS2]